MWDTIIIQPFTNVLLAITLVVKNFGVAIILFTILIKLITWPLTNSQLKASKKMQELQGDPRYKKIQVKYKNDKEKFAQEQMKLYKELGINPLGSCLPTLIQFPIIIGLYQSITKAMAATPFELLNLERLFYGFLEPTKLLPLQNKFLWMDLGQPERLPIFGIQIPVLAIIVVLTTFLQSKLMQPPTTSNDQGAAFSKAMNLYMPILMGWMAYSLASGLALYFLISNIVTIVQYAMMGRVNWSNVLPFIKKKELPSDKAKVTKAEVIEVEPFDDDDDEEDFVPVKTGKPSSRSMTKKKRPPLKKKK
ncbi:MAG: YidC/Oxa1 family membrane protein insertase [Anaerolineaceae bacterium]|nr:YidC/Oxa1 family membrane protein insertase [Anaerolineaceae bacterium]